MTRRAELLDAALEFVVDHGLVGLSLRPLAAALDTSDRMLIYHFGSKDQLIADVLTRAQQRLAEDLDPPGDDVRSPADLVRHLWSALTIRNGLPVTRLYLETCLLALAEPDKWRDAPERLRGPWREPLHEGLIALGVPRREAAALTTLVLDTLDGLALDRLTARDPERVDAAAAAFAVLVDRRSSPPKPPTRGGRAR